MDDYELGLAVPAVETGTMNRSASILIQSGFNSRLAAIKAVTDTAANFTNGAELRDWLRSPGLAVYSAQPNWNGKSLVLAPDGHAIGLLQHPLNLNRRGLVRATVAMNNGQINLSYLGPDDLWVVAKPH